MTARLHSATMTPLAEAVMFLATALPDTLATLSPATITIRRDFRWGRRPSHRSSSP